MPHMLRAKTRRWGRMRWTNSLVVLVAIALSGSSIAPSRASLTIAHPDRSSARIEYFEEHPKGVGPWPTIILLHGHQGPMRQIGGRAFADWGVLSQWSRSGYLAVSVSLPGYGASSGPKDFAGPFTQHAVEAVIAKLKADNQAIPTRVAIEGVSLGAVTGALVAANDRQLAGLVLISGLYDLPAFFAHPTSAGAQDVKAAAFAQTGGGDEALRSRSVLLLASRIRAATLILNGAKDDRTDARQARALAEAINQGGGRAETHIYMNFGHEIPFNIRDELVEPFLRKALQTDGLRVPDRRNIK